MATLHVLLLGTDLQGGSRIFDQLQSGGFQPVIQSIADLAELDTCLETALLTGSLNLSSPPPWDIVIADYDRPVSGRLDALERIHRDWPDLPFIFLASRDGVGLANLALKAGASDFILKSDMFRLGRSVSREIETLRLRRQTRWAERAQNATLQISESASATDNLDQLYRSIHRIIGELMPAANFYIALYDPASNLLSFPYYQDEFDTTPEPYPLSGGLTEIVLRTGAPLLAPRKEYDRMIRQGEVQAIGTPAVDWLGVPLKVRERIIGVLVVQSYTEGVRYGKQEVDLLMFVSTQIAMAIAQKQSEVRLRHQLNRLAALRVVDTQITTSFNLPVTLQTLLDQLRLLLHVDAAAVLVSKNDRGDLHYKAGTGFITPVSQRTEWDIEQGCAGYVARNREKVLISDLSSVRGSRRLAILAGEGFVGYIGLPLVARGQVKGVLEVFHRTALSPNRDWMEFLETLAGQAAIAIDNAQLIENLERSNQELEAAYDATIEGWARALELRDQETEGHSERVVHMTVLLAEIMGIHGDDMVHIRRGALLHDIGKMAIPDDILLKPGPLTSEEWDVMRRHPSYAYEMLYPVKYLRPALEIPYSHHEKFNGTGYPQKLKGERIPLPARIFAIVDVWDALRSNRPYRMAWAEEKALSYIIEQRGVHFDPQVVEAFVQFSPWKVAEAALLAG